MSAHFVRFPDCQFVDRAEQLWHENGRMICCPVARTARLRGGRRGAKNCRHCASVPVTQTRRNRDRMWECRTAHAHSDIHHLVRASPRHPASVRKCSMWLPVLFRFLVDSLATLGHRLAASGITSRMLSVIPLLFFRG